MTQPVKKLTVLLLLLALLIPSVLGSAPTLPFPDVVPGTAADKVWGKGDLSPSGEFMFSHF